jgi:predicted O-methyltransferase YrrM
MRVQVTVAMRSSVDRFGGAVNSVLERILKTQQVFDGTRSLPLRHPDFPDLPVALDRAEGALLQRIIADVQPRTTLEIGCAYGVSTLFICEALASLPHPSRHIVLDPFQRTQWRGLGLTNVLNAGFGSFIDFREEPSEAALPHLLRQGETVEVALIDGWHTFDQVMIEFYYLNRLLSLGGVLVFDDADRRSVNRVVRHALTYPAYRVYGTERPKQLKRRSALGRVRRALAATPFASRVVRPDVLHRDWDLGILGSCVAIQKIAADQRSSGWDQTF